MEPECVGIIEAEQDPSAKLDYGIKFERALSNFWCPSENYTTGTRVRSRRSGLQFNASSGGRAGPQEPRWPTTVGGTVIDGGITWTAEASSTASLTSTLASAAWTVESGITLSGQSINGQKASVFAEGGIDGQSYNLVGVGTMADSRKFVGVFKLTIKRKVSCD